MLEAIPAVVMGLLVYWVLDDRPEAAHWLSEREKALIRQDLQADAQGKTVVAKYQGSYAAFKDVRVYVAALVYSAIGAASALISLWTPTLIKRRTKQFCHSGIRLEPAPYIEVRSVN
ncbi:hypothetical protein DN412_15010 [Cupriavidus lacunae]|uniref:Uncharacterized protein n=1 Tax=Cupriavidus lacunae TaxID=2666307 RepID=A0A370NV66_9BURK|nr:hypothetical protein DN412_15010 [Cupriavidus lacunae]